MKPESVNARLLANRISSGDRSAENALAEYYSSGVVAALRAWGCVPDLAEEISNDALWTVIKRLRRKPLADPDKLAGFIVGTARKKWSNIRKKNVRQNTYCDSEHLERMASGAQGPADIAQREERARIVYQLLGELRNARDRQILIRFYLDEADKARICRELDMDERNFNNAIYRARMRFHVLVERAEKGGNLKLV